MSDNNDIRGESQGWSIGIGRSVSWSGPITPSVEEQFERMKHRLMALKTHEEFWVPQDRGFIDGDGI